MIECMSLPSQFQGFLLNFVEIFYCYIDQTFRYEVTKCKNLQWCNPSYGTKSLCKLMLAISTQLQFPHTVVAYGPCSGLVST